MKAPHSPYKEAGVDIDTGNRFVQKIKPFLKKTERPEVLSRLGHFAGLFQVNKLKYTNPVLVSSTDGVGTKILIAVEMNRFDTIGIDLVAMCVNDVLCLGAEPLFFLDYYASGKLDIEAAATVVRGIAKACADINCSLIGGETAEMPSIYRDGDFDMAGFTVGIVDRDQIIDGSSISIGNKIIGIGSSGCHSNGYSLVRKILKEAKASLKDHPKELKTSLGESLLMPTRIYVNTVMNLKRDFSLHGIAHITGGGLLENLPRVLPAQCRAEIRLSNWPRPPLFTWLQKEGKVEEEEMQRVFNCGIGLMLVVPAPEVEDILQRLKSLQEEAWLIGEIVERKKGEPSLSIL
ncbi:MAG: phosphoribosylformylglycinamidine cyclo-ligase [Deltaproteobacteria bacterium]|nr:phosphoribosylformylglycinamidine cyclo-ligase [Deltaproteobacteria bacterium]